MAATRTVRIDCLSTTGTHRVRVPAQAEMSAQDARTILLSLSTGIESYRGLDCAFDDPDGDCNWFCELCIDGDWYPATMPDHYAEGAEIHWSH